MSEALELALDRPFTFKQRPTPLACDLRPEWRLHLLVLLVLEQATRPAFGRS
jgi:hypothetical protein